VHFLQIWIVPDRQRVTPRYQQTHFAEAEKRGRLRLIISPDAATVRSDVYQDARVWAGLFDGAERADFDLAEPGRYAYVHVARGRLRVNGIEMTAQATVRASARAAGWPSTTAMTPKCCCSTCGHGNCPAADSNPEVGAGDTAPHAGPTVRVGCSINRSLPHRWL
jgi:hypothetical protein